MKLCFRCPKESEYDEVYNFYSELIDTSSYVPNWKMGYFPDEETLREALKMSRLIFGEADGKPVAAAIDMDRADHTEIDLLGVLPAYTRKGFAREMVENIIIRARLRGHERIQLEVLDGNTPAEALYISMGFEHIGTREVNYERTGRMVFKVYEHRLKK